MRQADEGKAGGAADDRAVFRSSRRAILRGGLGAVTGGVLAMAEGRTGTVRAETVQAPAATSAGSPTAVPDDVAIYPAPGTRTASPGTEITFRGASAEALGAVKVVGARSGGHSGILLPHSDDRGVSFLPDEPFRPGETVTVQAGLPLGDAADETVTFTVARPVAPPKAEAIRETENPEAAPRSFRSRPDLLPPEITVTTPADGTAEGYVFVGAKTPDGQNGAMILDDRGELIWFSPLAVDVDTVNDVRVQMYRGQPVLTCWEGISQRGHGRGHFVVRDSSYQQIAVLRVGNGYPGADQHEFLLTPRGTALIIIYNAVRWDLSPVGGARNGTALDMVVQELDVATGRVVFEWHCLDHIDLDESYAELPEDVNAPFDYVHLNAVEPDGEGHLILCARHTHATYQIDHWTGEIRWRLNGKRSDFAMGEGTETAYHHDARIHPNGELTLFDNAASTDDADVPSRGVVLALDMDEMTATLAREYIHPTEILSISQGNMQMLPNGNAFVGWGSAPVFSEFGPDGSLRFNGRFPTHIHSYRAFRYPWTGLPSEAPAVAVESEAENRTRVYVSWNGSTEVVSWQVLAGSDPDRLRPVGPSAPCTGFETEIMVQTSEPFLAVQAEDRAGRVLGLSAAVGPGD
ncbi:MAG: arylsulfotransferase family protein [Thermomicrobiales bacterium]